MTAKEVPLIDLRAVHEPQREALLAALGRVLDSGRFVLGDEVSSFEAEVAATLAVPFAVGVSNGTDALVCALAAAGVGAGDVVLTTSFSFVATLGAILRVGATPRFCDIDPGTFNLDPTALRRVDRSGVKAALVVHLFGRAADVNAIAAELGDVPIVHDAAQAFGACSGGRDGARVSVARSGAAAAFSFFPGKPLGALGDAGLVTTANAETAEVCRRLRVHGRVGSETTELVGGNYRLDELQAACLRVKLPTEASRRAARRANAQAYDTAFAGLSGLTLPGAFDVSAEEHVWSVYALRVHGCRDALRQHLLDRGVQTAVYYPTPLPREPMWVRASGGEPGLAASGGEFPEAERACRELLALPIAAELGSARIGKVIDAVRDFFAPR